MLQGKNIVPIFSFTRKIRKTADFLKASVLSVSDQITIIGKSLVSFKPRLNR